MTVFQVGQPVFTINSRGSRATPGTVVEITTTDIRVHNRHKDEDQFFDISAPHLALGDYWDLDAMRPRLVPTDDSAGQRLYREAQHRDWSERVRQASRRFHDTPNTRTYMELKDMVEEWGNWVASWD